MLKIFIFILFYGNVIASDFINNWVIKNERCQKLQEIEDKETSGQTLLQAGSWSDSPIIFDTITTKTTIHTKNHFLKWSPFVFTGINLVKDNTAVFPLEVGHVFTYKYKNNLVAYIDGFIYRRTNNPTNDIPLLINDRGTEDYIGVFKYGHIGKASSFNARQTIAYMEFKSSVLNIGFGKRLMRWGNGFNGGLVISSNAPPINLFYNLNKKIGKYIYLTAFFGTPDYNGSYFPENIKGNLKTDGERYIAGHRIEFTMKNRFKIGINELANLSGQREFNRYFNPLRVYYLVSSNSELASNLLASIEIWTKIIPGLAIYGEILDDDITMFEKGNPTRLAYQLGSHWISIKNHINVRTEYTYVRAYTYTHFYNSQNWHIWSNRCAGYWLGPDTDHLYFHIEKNKSDKVKIRTSLNFIRRGEKNLLTPWIRNIEGTGENVNYLQGVVENTIGTDIGTELKIKNRIKLFSVLGLQHSENYKHNKNQTKNIPYFQTYINFSL